MYNATNLKSHLDANPKCRSDPRQQQESSQKRYECPGCKRPCFSAANLKRHLDANPKCRSHPPQQQEQQNQNQQLQHQQQQESTSQGQQQHACDTQQQNTQQPQQQHIPQEKDDKTTQWLKRLLPHLCSDCRRNYDHEFGTHKCQCLFKCSKCSKEFHNRNNFERHQSKCAGPEVECCCTCGASCDEIEIQAHKKHCAHKDCPVCKLTFTT